MMQGSTNASTKDTVVEYFKRLQLRTDWQSLLADDMMFTSRTSPARQLMGRDAYVSGTSRFFSMIVDSQVLDLIVDGEKACALTRYRLQPPGGGATFESDVAEVFSVNDGAITALTIYFDSAPYPKPPK